MDATIRPDKRPWWTLLPIALAALLTFAAIIGLAVVLLNPPRQDIEALILFLALSGALSLALGYLAARLGWRLLWGGLRFRIAFTVAVGVVVALANVAVTAYLMFLSPHDLTLLSLLLLFALVISLSFGVFLAGRLTSSLRELAQGAGRMAEGNLSVRAAVSEGGEVGELAIAFNTMAARLEASFRQQREVEQARKDLIAAVSHDLRTPLASLQAMVEAVNDGVVSDPETIQRYLHTMQTEIANLSALINDLFELSQLDASVLCLHIESSPLQDVIFDTVDSLQAQAQRHGLNLATSVDTQLEPVLMDPARVQRVLYNLVQNAIRHTPSDGTVLLEARDTGAEVHVSVEDTGEGIAEGDLPHVFERFYRGDPARSRERGGIGLGLSIARGIVEAHGGRIWVESTPGQGSKFSFALPKADPQAARNP
ncbi:MAG: HAMP domain-containing sensor histidine kinase [Dehalococcoidales bacterium]|nr:HAMP domain-containing sensor histidine kinase [Dehalococcoidales bacterium]